MQSFRQTRSHNQRLRIRLAFAVLILLLVVPGPTGLAAPSSQGISSQERAQALLTTLTPAERVGQLFLVTFNGTDTGVESQIRDLIINHHIGGVILEAENNNFIAAPQTLPQAQQMIRNLQTNEWTASQSRQVDPITNQEFDPAFIPLFIAISQEGNGPPFDQILHGMTPLPSQMAIGATWNPKLAENVGSVLGSELSALGFNLLLGPSLDVLENPRRQGTGDLGVRTFGGDPYWVGEMGRAFVTGVHTGSGGRIAVVAKHFPGHGSSDRLPEEEVATVPKSLEQLKLIELPPFHAVTGSAPAEEAVVDGLLRSHIRYQGFQGNIRETTRPVSLDRQAFDQLMALPDLDFDVWRESGGIMISDDLGNPAFRRFIDPTDVNFRAPLIARDAFLAGNDLLTLGQGFIATNELEPDYYNTIIRTLGYFAQKYADDDTFRQSVDQAVLRILTLKYRLYDDILTLNQVLSAFRNPADLGESGQVTFEVAQQAATLIYPSLVNLAETLPEPPNLNDRIVFLTDTRRAQQCNQCPEETAISERALEQVIVRLYGPGAGGLVLQRNLVSYSFEEFLAFLDNTEESQQTDIESDLQQAHWIVFSTLNVSTNEPASQALSRFLAEQPGLFRQKRLVVFAFDAPYYLDATEISKLNAYYGLYSKAPQFVEVAARLLFGELPAPPGHLPVSVLGVDYDLISVTAPNPNQTIQLFLDQPVSEPSQGTATPEPTPVPEFEVGDQLPVRTGKILDHNGNPVPDDTPVQFFLSIDGEPAPPQVSRTRAGIARTTFLIDRTGIIEVRAVSIDATSSTVLRFDIPPEGGLVTGPAPTIPPTASPTPEPSPTITPTPESTPTPLPPASTDLGDWFLAFVVVTGISAIVYWLTALFGVVRWGVRAGFLALIGGMLAYLYLAMGMPGSDQVIRGTGSWGILLLTIFGSSLGWGAAWSWQKLDSNSKKASG